MEPGSRCSLKVWWSSAENCPYLECYIWRAFYCYFSCLLCHESLQVADFLGGPVSEMDRACVGRLCLDVLNGLCGMKSVDRGGQVLYRMCILVQAWCVIIDNAG